MFELYGVPKLLYCVDSMMSFYNNNHQQNNSTLSQLTSPFLADGLVISFNTASTSVIPVLSGRGILNQCKRYRTVLSLKFPCLLSHRIPWGSMQAVEYLQKLVQLKYPSFPSKVTTPQFTVSFRVASRIYCVIHRDAVVIPERLQFRVRLHRTPPYPQESNSNACPRAHHSVSIRIDSPSGEK